VSRIDGVVILADFPREFQRFEKKWARIGGFARRIENTPTFEQVTDTRQFVIGGEHGLNLIECAVRVVKSALQTFGAGDLSQQLGEV
jgi:hypothetical protein